MSLPISQWFITSEAFPALEQSFKTAAEKGLLLYDIMTERFEITNILQKELANTPEVFGGLVDGTVEEPAIVIESVHNFCKVVSGVALKTSGMVFLIRLSRARVLPTWLLIWLIWLSGALSLKLS